MQLVIHAPFGAPDQQGVGPGAAQAVLPLVQLRAAGRGDRQRHQHRARRAAQLPAGAMSSTSCTPATAQRSPRAGGTARRRSSARAGDGMRGRVARAASASAAASECRFTSSACSPDDLLASVFPDVGRVSGEHRRRHRDSRPSARARGHEGRPDRGDGSRGPQATCSNGIADGTHPMRRRRHAGAVGLLCTRSSTRIRSRIWTTRRSRSGGRERVEMRRVLPESVLSEVGRLDPNAIAEVRRDAWPDVRDADDLHDALQTLIAIPVARHGSAPRRGRPMFDGLVAGAGERSGHDDRRRRTYWVAAERGPDRSWQIFPEARVRPRRSAGVDVDHA